MALSMNLIVSHRNDLRQLLPSLLVALILWATALHGSTEPIGALEAVARQQDLRFLEVDEKGPVELLVSASQAALTRKISRSVLTMSSADADVYVQLEGDIPLNSRLHLVIAPSNPGGTYDPLHADAHAVLTWRRDAQGSYDNAQPGQPYLAFRRSAGLEVGPVVVDLVAESWNGLAMAGTHQVRLVWTLTGRQP